MDSEPRPAAVALAWYQHGRQRVAVNERRGLDTPCRNRLNAEPLGQAADYAIRATVASPRQGQRHDACEFRSHAGLMYLEPSPDHHRARNAR